MKPYLGLTCWLIFAACYSPAQIAYAQTSATTKIQKTELPDPAVDFILKSNPNTTQDLFYAVKSLVDLGRPDLAAPLMKRLIESKPDDAVLAALVGEYGGAAFSKLAMTKELGPDVPAFALQAVNAADQQSRDPQRLALLIEQLKAPETRKRLEAIVALRRGRDAAAAAMIAVLADPNRAAEHAQIRAALPALTGDALAPLVGALQAEDPDLQVSVCEVLGDLGDPRGALYLLVPALSQQSPAKVQAVAKEALVKLMRRVPTVSEGAANLYGAARQSYENPGLAAATALPRWNYDVGAKQVVLEELPPEVAALATAADFAGNARDLLPTEINIRRLYLASLLDAASYREGLAKPLSHEEGSEAAEVGAEGPFVVEDLLDHSMRGNRPVTAAAAARILGDLNRPEILYTSALNGGRSVLARAALHKNRRVRFAAVEAIIKLKPAEPFPGSSAVPDSLAFFAASIGAPRALVADVRASEAARIAGLLLEMGYEADVATDVRSVLSLATRSPDYELILLDMTLAEPTSGQLIQQLRRDARTATVPIGLICDSNRLERAEVLARRETLAAAIIRPVNPVTLNANEPLFYESRSYRFVDVDRRTGLVPDPELSTKMLQTLDAPAGLEFQTHQLLARVGQPPVSVEERKEQAARALDWLVELSSRPGGFYDLRQVEESVGTALSTTGLSEQAGQVLANLGTNRGQRALVDRASRSTLPLAARQAAGRSFAASVARHGTLLTTGEILVQYDRYNQSAKLDKETQAVLASILDSIEARAKGKQAAVSRGESPPEKAEP